eukprot:TRINITY_DN6698_c0_g1_i1.p1 TRINITY_DN6698_c0_g1~~TRINITY_DN6698_c0_g1_i1.p1  ORF type:complete len:900 (+),score=120.13 TRINITY_DN6698_c0_g1_i1:57-2756(+)
MDNFTLFINDVIVSYPDMTTNVPFLVNFACWFALILILGIFFVFLECCFVDPQKTKLSFVNFWNHSAWPVVNEIVDSVLGIISIILFVYEVWYIESQHLETGSLDDSFWRNPLFIWYQFITSCFLIIHWLLQFYMASNRILFIFTPIRLGMIISVIPGFLGPFFSYYYFGFQFFHFLRISDSLHFFRSRDFGFKRIVVVIMDILILTLSVLGVILITSALVFVHECTIIHPTGSLNNYGDALYFLFITMTTVGYGDFSPNTYLGRISVMIGITASLWLIPISVSRIAEYLKSINSNFQVGNEYQNHSIILTPHQNCSRLIINYFRKRSGVYPERLVVFAPDIIPIKSDTTMAKPQYRMRSVFFQGDLFDQNALNQIRVKSADVCFLLADSLSATPMQDDANTLVVGESILHMKRQIRLYAQIRCYQNKNIFGKHHNVHTCCTTEIEYLLMAKSIPCPGYSTLMCNILINPPKTDPSSVNRSNQLPAEYYESLKDNLFISLDLSPYISHNFESVLKDLIEENILLIGVHQFKNNVSLIKPKNYKIQKGDNGIVICCEDLFISMNSQYQNTEILSASFSEDTIEMSSEIDSDSFIEGVRQEIRTELDNFQEFLELEAEYIKEIELAKDRIIENEDHTIIYRYDVSDFDYFFDLISNDISGFGELELVIMTEVEPTIQIWELIKRLGISIILGRGTDLYDLKRAGVDNASRFMIFAQNSNSSMADRDARSLMIYRFVQDRLSQKHSSNCFSVVELLNPPNTNFLSSSQYYMLNEYYAAGRVTLPSITDNIMIEDNYQHGFMNVFHTLLTTPILIVPAKQIFTFKKKSKYPFFEAVTRLVESDDSLLPIGIYRNYKNKNFEPDDIRENQQQTEKKKQAYVLVGGNRDVYSSDWIFVLRDNKTQ